MVDIRVASTQDQALVVELFSELVDELGPAELAERVKPLLAEDIRVAFATPLVRIFLAEDDGETIGLARADVLTQDPIFRLRDDHRCGYVDQMYVRAAHRDRGVGSLLLARCEAWFRSQGIGHALLHAAPKATGFYSSAGYQPNREMFKRL